MSYKEHKQLSLVNDAAATSQNARFFRARACDIRAL